MISKPQLVDSTYQRDGKWYTLRAIDRTNQIETAATDDEIAAASPAVAETPAKAKAKK